MKAKITALIATPLLALSLTACSSGDAAPAVEVTKENVTAGLAKALQAQLKEQNLASLDETIVQDYATCIVDKTWTKLSDEGKALLAKGNNESIADSEISEEDGNLIQKNVSACQDVLIKSMTNSNSSN